MFLIACIANPYLQSCIARKDAAKEWRLLVKYIMKPLSSKMKIALNNANETIETRLWKMFAGSLQLFVRKSIISVKLIHHETSSGWRRGTSRKIFIPTAGDWRYCVSVLIKAINSLQPTYLETLYIEGLNMLMKSVIDNNNHSVDNNISSMTLQWFFVKV